jgi:hypothetical protein
LPALLLAMALIPLLASRRWPQERRGAATAGAVLVGVALPLLAFCALSGPVVSCGSDSVSGGENVFMGLMSGDSTSEMSSGSDGSSGGHASGGGYEYSFECRDGELASFRLRWR